LLEQWEFERDITGGAQHRQLVAWEPNWFAKHVVR
jgi:hypothetical protein